jgi:hypothetical protein
VTTQDVLDPVPIGVVFLLFTVLTFGCFEVGFRLGVWWQAREPGEQEGPTDMLVGSLLGLMAFVLAITLGLATDRYDARRGLVVAEANAITTAYQRADYLPAAEAARLKALLRAYAPLRIVTDPAAVPANIAASAALARQMWAIVVAAAQAGDNSDLIASLGESLNELVAVSEQRVVAGVYARVPQTIMLLLLAGSALSLAMVGYSAGIKGRRSVLSATVLILTLGVVTMLVVDLDRPQEGLLRVSQQALVDAQRFIAAPP